MKNQNKFLKILAIFLTVIYPFVVFTALHQGYSLRLMSLILAGIVLLNFIRHKHILLLIAGMTLTFALYIFQNTLFLKLYPVLMNTGITMIFALSLRNKPLLQIFAERMGYKPTENLKNYTRKATLAWTIFLLFMTCISLATVFTTDFVWTLYNGCIAYILIALMFGVEYCYRRHRCPNQ